MPLQDDYSGVKDVTSYISFFSKHHLLKNSNNPETTKQTIENECNLSHFLLFRPIAVRQIADTNFDCVLHGFFDSRQLPIKKPMERRVIEAAGYRLPKENIEKIRYHLR